MKKRKLIFAAQTLVSLLFVAVLICIKKEPVHTVLNFAYSAYLIVLWFIMLSKCKVMVNLLDNVGTWQEVAEKIAAENPKERIPAKTSSQRFIWFVWHGYDFGDERLREAKADYKPYTVAFYGSLILYIFAVLV